MTYASCCFKVILGKYGDLSVQLHLHPTSSGSSAARSGGQGVKETTLWKLALLHQQVKV
jgi:hypothetical protein